MLWPTLKAGGQLDRVVHLYAATMSPTDKGT